MRGTDQDQSTMFSYVSPEARIPADHPLRATREMTNRALARLDRKFRKLYSRTGRPSIPPEQLLRALLLQVLYSIRSERMLMERTTRRLSRAHSTSASPRRRRRAPRSGSETRSTRTR